MMNKRLFRVSFKDGDKRLLSAETMISVLNYILHVLNYADADIAKIEEIEEV